MVSYFQDFNYWECTDPDALQFAKKFTEHEWYYLQLKPSAVEKVEQHFANQPIGGSEEVRKYIYENLNNKDVWFDLIDVECYTQEEIDEYLAPYGDILYGCWTDEQKNQLIAECIFETDYVMSND